MFKVIFTTISATLIAVSLAASLFTNTILGAFGLVSTSLETLITLQDSHQKIGEVKKRHQSKQNNASKKFIKRSSQKIASSAVSAATIGTAAVVITVAGLEVHYYCEDKKELQEDENLLFGRDIQFDYKNCMRDAKKDSDEIILSVKKAVPEAVDNAWEQTKDFSNETLESTKKMSADAWISTLNASSDLWESLTDLIN